MAGVESIDFVDTYSAAYRRDIFLANGGFDSTFPTASVEDQEFSFRLAEKGYRLVFVPAAKVFHRHNHTLSAYIRRKFLIGYWKVLVTRRHPGRAVRDSHTPQALKLQMGLAAVTRRRIPYRRPGEPGWLGAERASTGGWPARRPGFRTDRDSLSGEGLAPGSRRDFARGRPAVGARVRPGDRIRPGADPLSRPLRREPAADCWLAAGRQAPHGCRSGGDDPGS